MMPGKRPVSDALYTIGNQEKQSAAKNIGGCVTYRPPVSNRQSDTTNNKLRDVILGNEAGEVTENGAAFLSKLGVDLSIARARRRVFCRPCVDWTERRPHIGGAVGAAIATRCFELKWIERFRDGRALTITSTGRRGLIETFDLAL
jgi:hypothetical protein